MPSQGNVAVKRLTATVDAVFSTVRLCGLALRITWRASPWFALGILLLLVLQAVLQPLQLALSRSVIDRMAFDLDITGTADSVVTSLPLATWIALMALVLVIGQLIQPFALTCQALVGDRLTGYITQELIIATNRWSGLSRFEDPQIADDLKLAQTQAASGGLKLLVYGGQAAAYLLTSLSLAIVLFRLHPLVPFLLLASNLPHMLLHWEFRARTGRRLYKQTQQTRRLQLTRDQLLAPEPAKDVQFYALGPFFRKRYDDVFIAVMEELDRDRNRLLLRVALASAVGALVSGAIYLYLVMLIAQGDRTVGEFLLYGGAVMLLQSSLLNLASDLGYLPILLKFLPSLFRILDAPPDLPISPAGRRMSRPIQHGIVFDHVGFTYPGSETPVLRDVSFTLSPNTCLALVGRNGAGKSTLVKLLLRLYDPTSGRILLNGVDLRDYDLSDLRAEMGVIFQDFVRFELSGWENIGVGQLDAIRDRGRLKAAAMQAGADQVLTRLPYGPETILGRELGERDLSGGEWQKLALARAFVRDAQILVLDEPTASLDIPTEYDIFTRFRDLTRGRTTLLISHRFSTVRMADRILFLEEGAIQEEGSHAELIAHNGRYAQLYRLQAAQFHSGKVAGLDV